MLEKRSDTGKCALPPLTQQKTSKLKKKISPKLKPATNVKGLLEAKKRLKRQPPTESQSAGDKVMSFIQTHTSECSVVLEEIVDNVCGKLNTVKYLCLTLSKLMFCLCIFYAFSIKEADVVANDESESLSSVSTRPNQNLD